MGILDQGFLFFARKPESVDSMHEPVGSCQSYGFGKLLLYNQGESWLKPQFLYPRSFPGPASAVAQAR